jgi:hypothetical protein
MMAPTTESVYQQTETEIVYRPTTTLYHANERPHIALLNRISDAKNPLKIPQALRKPDRSVNKIL